MWDNQEYELVIPVSPNQAQIDRGSLCRMSTSREANALCYLIYHVSYRLKNVAMSCHLTYLRIDNSRQSAIHTNLASSSALLCRLYLIIYQKKGYIFLFLNI